MRYLDKLWKAGLTLYVFTIGFDLEITIKVRVDNDE